MFVGLIPGPGRDGLRLVAMVERATDADGTLDDTADDAGVARGSLAGEYGVIHGAVTSIR
ncbi:hypothetical protein D3C87_1460480 [compost metagenome]